MITFYIRPTIQLAMDPWNAVRQAGDIHLIGTVRATLPDWYIWTYGRHRGLWMGAEHMIMLLQLVQAPHLPYTTMGMILRLSHYNPRQAGLDVSEVVYYRQNPHLSEHAPWKPTARAAEVGYPINEQVNQKWELAFPIQTGVN